MAKAKALQLFTFKKRGAAPRAHSPIGKAKAGTEEEQQQEEIDNATRPRCFARAYHVFNAAQVDGYETKPEDLLPEAERIAQAEAFFQSLPATINHGGDRAYYSPSGDYIQMPPFAQFKSAEKYVSVLCHELSHWTGAKNRFNRDLSGRFGDASYAMEEMVAQISASFLCADLQIRNEPSHDDAAYVSNWLRVLRGDRRAIFTAASKAQEAASYLMRSIVWLQSVRYPSNRALISNGFRMLLFPYRPSLLRTRRHSALRPLPFSRWLLPAPVRFIATFLRITALIRRTFHPAYFVQLETRDWSYLKWAEFQHPEPQRLRSPHFRQCAPSRPCRHRFGQKPPRPGGLRSRVLYCA